MDSDIQFGEIEETRPEPQLRPDKNRHYAVAAWGEPEEGDLPIYVDLDVMHDMETHAQSDTSVELGGVLLGGQYEDADGKPFVLVTDSLRANHYEATKGSFKFTHDTWSQITREREEYPPELQMVGWYHTHPDWGVFLSGMDMFICDNFFNKKLDIALVIDPCRGDRGMFMWTGNPRQRVRRTGGFFLVASRYRQQELEQFTQALQGNEPMPASPSSGGFGAPVVHVHGDKQPPWMPLAVLGMPMLQFCVVALIAWKLLAPGDASDREQLVKRLVKEQTQAREETQRQLLQDIAADIKGDLPSDYVDALAKRNAELRDARTKLSDKERDYANLRNNLVSAQQDLTEKQDSLKSLKTDLEKAKEERKALAKKKDDRIEELRTRLSSYEPTKDKEDAKDDSKSTGLNTWWIVGIAVALLAVGALALAVWQQNAPPPDDAPEPATARPSVKPAAPAVDAAFETPAEKESPAE